MNSVRRIKRVYLRMWLGAYDHCPCRGLLSVGRKARPLMSEVSSFGRWRFGESANDITIALSKARARKSDVRTIRVMATELIPRSSSVGYGVRLHGLDMQTPNVVFGSL